MSSWSEYITTQLLSSGVMKQGAILGKSDLSLYAEEGGFQLKPAYQATVTQDDGTEKSETIDEAAALVAFYGDNKTPKWGFRMNGIKYQLMRKQEDGPTLYLKCSTGGACVSAANTVVIVGVYAASGNEAMAAQVACNAAVENLAEYLRGNGF